MFDAECSAMHDKCEHLERVAACIPQSGDSSEAASLRSWLLPVSAPAALSQEFLAALDKVPERVRLIALLRGLGFPSKAIGRLFGATPHAVSMMLHRHRRLLGGLNGSFALHGLSARAINALGRYKIRTPAEARSRNILALLQGQTNCGKRTLDEIARWMAQEDRKQDIVRGTEGATCPQWQPESWAPDLEMEAVVPAATNKDNPFVGKVFVTEANVGPRFAYFRYLAFNTDESVTEGRESLLHREAGGLSDGYERHFRYKVNVHKQTINVGNAGYVYDFKNPKTVELRQALQTIVYHEVPNHPSVFFRSDEFLHCSGFDGPDPENPPESKRLSLLNQHIEIARNWKEPSMAPEVA